VHRQVQLIKDSKPLANGRRSSVKPDTPWQGEELKHFWALANNAFGRERATERVYDIIAFRCKKSKLHELSRPEFLVLLNDLRFKAGDNLDAIFADTPMEPSWRRIRWLQRELGWTDARLINYIGWHGRKTGTNVDNIKWLTVQKARGIVIAMQRMRARERGLR
jgi:hypothetical protein